MTLFEEMDLESEGKLSFKQVMGGEESPLESLFRYETMMSMMVSLQTTLFRSMDKEGRGSISKDVNIISLNCCTDILIQYLASVCMVETRYLRDLSPPTLTTLMFNFSIQV